MLHNGHWNFLSLDTIDNINHIWKELRNILLLSNEASLEEIIVGIDNLGKENVVLKENEISLTKDLEYISQQLIDVDQQCEQLKQLNKELLLKKSTNSLDDDQLTQDYILLENQYTQLDNANRAWQQFYDNQIDLLKNKFKDYLDFDENLNFDQIIQIIATKLDEQKHLKTNIPSDDRIYRVIKSSVIILSMIFVHIIIDLLTLGTTINKDNILDISPVDTQSNNQIINLQEEIKCLEQQLKDDLDLIDSLKNNFQLITQENVQLTKQYDEIQQKNDLLSKENHNLTNRLNQLENQSFSFDSPQENGKFITFPKVQKSQLSNTKKQQHISNNSLFTALQLSSNQIQRTDHSPIEETSLNIISHVQSSNMKQEIEQLRNDLAITTTKCTQFDEANRAWQQYYQNQLELFHEKLQDWISLDANASLEQIAHQIAMYLNQLAYERNLLLQNNNPSGTKLFYEAFIFNSNTYTQNHS
ncbi:unnamed protein product [Rotaria sp. Silwood2]|nr:unnamed protein product [Rotaria sp. Silwood2]